MFYKKFAAVVLSAVLVGAVPCSVLGASDVSSVTDGVVEELSMEDDFSDGADSISALASALADKTVSEVQDYQEAKAEAEVIAQERLEAEAAAEAARKAEEERKAAEEAARKAEEERLAKRQEIVDFALQLVIWFFMVMVGLTMWLFILVMARSFTPVQQLRVSRFPTIITGLRLQLVRLWNRE